MTSRFNWQLTSILLANALGSVLVGVITHHIAGGIVIAAVLGVATLLWWLHPEMPASILLIPRPKVRDRQRSMRLARTLRNLRTTAMILPEAIIIVDRKQRICWFNHAAKDLLGLSWPRDRKALLQTFLSGNELTQWLQHEVNNTAAGISAHKAFDRHIRLDEQADHKGSELTQRSIDVKWLPWGNDHCLLLAQDISSITQLEQMRRDFVANVSHELRTPLTVIYGYLEMLSTEDLPEWEPMLNEMRTQSTRMAQIVESLLTLSRLETQETLDDERIEMKPLLNTLYKEAQLLSQGNHHIILDNAAHLDLLGSPGDLHSALSNLISNAVRYTPNGGRITISWRNTSTGAAYTVKDTGMGIPVQHIDRLTERFYRVSTSRSRATGGTGLGLSIVKHVLNLHQGQLEVHSKLGEGSCFTCHFKKSRLLPEQPSDYSQKI